MNTNDRDDTGVRELRALYDAIDKGQKKDAEQLYQTLLSRWGNLDTELIRIQDLITDMDSEA